ncbi:MAG: tetratricopeptide repeat protein [Aquabacterium sp.]|uniref:tetratricopeptide repeat protein n=1 Tax=Aquabacterium sp. TaxID=1872578 RepID=UPI003BBCAB13
MTPFILTSSLLALLASACAVYPLLRKPSSSGPFDARPLPGLAAGLTLGILTLTAVLYSLIGNHDAWRGPIPVAQLTPETSGPDRPDEPTTATPPTPEQIEAMVGKLAARLQADPDDADGWRMLARSYETLGRFNDAAQAYQQLLSLQPPDADTLTDYAVVLGMTQGRTLAGPPEALLHQALKQEPGHVQALALSGSAAFERQDYNAAVQYWQQLLNVIPQGDEARASIEDNIAKARQLAQPQVPRSGQHR